MFPDQDAGRIGKQQRKKAVKDIMNVRKNQIQAVTERRKKESLRVYQSNEAAILYRGSIVELQEESENYESQIKGPDEQNIQEWVM